MNLLTTAEAAEILGITDSHVRRLILTDKLPAIHVGKRTLVLEREVVEQYQREHPKSKAGRPKGKRRTTQQETGT